MTLTYKIVSPNGNTTIAFAIKQCTHSIGVKLFAFELIDQVEERGSNKATKRKTWNLVGDAVKIDNESLPAGATGQAILEELITALETWDNQSAGAGGGRSKGELRLVAGKDKNGADWIHYGKIESLVATWKPGDADDEVSLREIQIQFKEFEVTSTKGNP